MVGERYKQPSDSELLEMYPIAREVIPLKLSEWKAERAKLVRQRRREMADMEEAADRWFWEMWIKAKDDARLREINRHIARLSRQCRLLHGVEEKGDITDTTIQAAKVVPMTDLVPMELRQTGRTLSGRCPLHNDRNPSLHIYTETNSWYCFGCTQGGDTISFIRALYSVNFPEAVRMINRHTYV